MQTCCLYPDLLIKTIYICRVLSFGKVLRQLRTALLGCLKSVSANMEGLVSWIMDGYALLIRWLWLHLTDTSRAWADLSMQHEVAVHMILATAKFVVQTPYSLLTVCMDHHHTHPLVHDQA
jgi:hypothetical protein